MRRPLGRPAVHPSPFDPAEQARELANRPTFGEDRVFELCAAGSRDPQDECAAAPPAKATRSLEVAA